MSTAEIAGNYVTSGGTAEDPAYVAEKLAEMQEDAAEKEAEAVDHSTTQVEVLHGDDPETIEVDVAGEMVEFDPVGLGRRARLMRRAQDADERGDDVAQLDVVLEMIDLLDDVSDDAHDQAWWDDRTESQIRAAFQTLGRRSAGGNA